MEYEIKNINNKNIINVSYETFDYYSIQPKEFNELTGMDEKLLTSLLRLNNNKLYVLSTSRYFKNFSDEYGLWKYHALPNEYPEDDFKYEVKFLKPLSEYKISGEKYNTFVGVAEISIDFYIKNYLFFNRNNETALFLCNENDIKDIINQINNFAYKLPEDDWLISTTNLAKLVINKCIYIEMHDSEKYKYINIIIEKEIQMWDIIRCITV